MVSEAEPTQKKKKKRTKSQPLPFMSLPDEIVENCLARVPNWKYPSLYIACKKFRCLLSSAELYKTRSQIGTKETYVCLQFPNRPFPSWFSLGAKSNQNPKRKKEITFRKKSSGKLLVPIPSSSCPSPPVPSASTLAVGSEIYVIGGPNANGTSLAVWILDCLSHTWRKGPDMNVARAYASANFLDEMIYVMGGCEIDECANNWMEVFDIKTQSWTTFPCPCDQDEVIGGIIANVVQGKLHVVLNTKEYIYEPKVGAWKVVRDPSSFKCVDGYVLGVVENVIYCCTYDGYCMWYDFESGKWEMVTGLDELREHPTKGLSNGNVLGMFDRGGKLLVMWESSRRKYEIWYAEISFETRCNGSDIRGKIEWVDAMLTVSGMPYSELVLCLTVSV